MALDESRVLTRAKLKESYLEVERQKAVMFATLNRVRQSLQDQGAQVFRCMSAERHGPGCMSASIQR
ncbi:hypothetical protein ABBQ38_002078 [Trebouxia sp. C0009 RCD-2024]